MGNKSTSMSPPFTSKKKSDFITSSYNIGTCEMQGWRSTMEDAKLIHLPKNKRKDFINESYDEEESKF